MLEAAALARRHLLAANPGTWGGFEFRSAIPTEGAALEGPFDLVISNFALSEFSERMMLE